MKLADPSPKAARDRLREQWRQSRAAAQTLRVAYPQIESIRFDLRFSDERMARAPAPQSYVLHPAAGAFFKFGCPCFDCDGHFDLTAAVSAALADHMRQFAGAVDCGGVRIKDSSGKQPCRLHVDYTLSVAYRSASRRPP